MICITPSGDVTFAGATKTVLALFNTAAKQGRIKWIRFACSGTSTDAAAKFSIVRLTANDGTAASTPTVKVMNASEGTTPLCTSKAGYTVEPTKEAGNIDEVVFNQKAVYTWY